MKKTEAFGQINAMSGIVKLDTIINTLKSIDNFQEETLDKLNPVDDYTGGTPLDKIYVDLDYQRKLKSQEILNRLLGHAGYDKTAAGHLDLAKRNDGRLFCWDGFHRGIMAGLAGCTNIPCSEFPHEKGIKPKKEKEIEANKFELRNGHASKVSAGALFKAQVTGNKPEALATLEVMKTCKLNIEGVNKDPEAYDLGGFAFFLKSYGNYDELHLSEASNIIRKTWPNAKTMSVYFLIGLTHFLTANSNWKADKNLGVMNILDKIKEIVGTGKGSKNQQYFIRPMLKGKIAESVSYNLVEKAFNVNEEQSGKSKALYNDDGAEVKEFLNELDLDDDEMDSLERE